MYFMIDVLFSLNHCFIVFCAMTVFLYLPGIILAASLEENPMLIEIGVGVTALVLIPLVLYWTDHKTASKNVVSVEKTVVADAGAVVSDVATGIKDAVETTSTPAVEPVAPVAPAVAPVSVTPPTVS